LRKTVGGESGEQKKGVASGKGNGTTEKGEIQLERPVLISHDHKKKQ